MRLCAGRLQGAQGQGNRVRASGSERGAEPGSLEANARWPDGGGRSGLAGQDRHAPQGPGHTRLARFSHRHRLPSAGRNKVPRLAAARFRVGGGGPPARHNAHHSGQGSDRQRKPAEISLRAFGLGVSPGHSLGQDQDSSVRLFQHQQTAQSHRGRRVHGLGRSRGCPRCGPCAAGASGPRRCESS